MPLVKAILETQLEELLKRQAERTANGETAEVARADLAAALADIIDQYVRSATVTTTVVGTSPSGPVTGTGTGNLT